MKRKLMWYESIVGWIKVLFTDSFIWWISEDTLHGGTWAARHTSFSCGPLGLAGGAHCLHLKLWIIKFWIKGALWIVFIDNKQQSIHHLYHLQWNLVFPSRFLIHLLVRCPDPLLYPHDVPISAGITVSHH